MAQEIITGLTGSITLPNGMSQFVSSISLNVGAALLPVPRYGGAGWEVSVSGLKRFSGQAVAFMSKGASGANPFDISGTVGEMTIQFDDGCYISANVVLADTNIAGSYEGLNVITFSFAKTDDTEPTVGWTEA